MKKSVEGRRPRYARIYCPACSPCAINGVACHERGCRYGKTDWTYRVRGLTDPMYLPEGTEPPKWARKEES